MSRGKKLLLAGIVLLVGLGGASLFRKDSTLDTQPQEPTLLAEQSQATETATSDTQARSQPVVPALRGLGIPVPSPAPRVEDIAVDGVGASGPAIPPASEQRGPPPLPPEFSTDWDEDPGEALRPIYRTDPGQEPAKTRSAEPAPERFHEVQDGDTLVSLAADYLYDADRHWEIYELNREVLVDGPALLPIGARLRIPPPRQRLADSVEKEIPSSNRLVPIKPAE